jgi:hypothetical protein
MMLIQNLNRYWLLYTGALLIVVVAFVGVFFTAETLDVSVKILTRDPYRAARVPPYYAYISLLGSTIWLSSGASTLAASLFARRTLYAKLSDDSTYRIMVIGGATGLLMAVDDILLFHDAVADIVGIPELMFHGFYAFCILYLIGTARGLLLRTPWILFFFSLGCFAASSVIDEFMSPVDLSLLDESEDVFKFCGILFWAIYFAQVCWDYMGSKRTVAESSEY